MGCSICRSRDSPDKLDCLEGRLTAWMCQGVCKSHHTGKQGVVSCTAGSLRLLCLYARLIVVKRTPATAKLGLCCCYIDSHV